ILMRGRSLVRLAAVLAIVAAAGNPASAQVTSASVAGVIKDASGGVIPGATVVLVSETKGTRSVPAVTSGTGDFLFATVATDTYTLEVSLSGFKTLKRNGIAVSPGDRLALGALTLQIGGATEVVDVKGETPLIQATT